jgi:hypothetical protein
LDVSNLTYCFHILGCLTKESAQFRRSFTYIITIPFLHVELLATRQTPKVQSHPFSATRDCVFSIFPVATISVGRLFHPQPGMRQAVETKDPRDVDICVSSETYSNLRALGGPELLLSYKMSSF